MATVGSVLRIAREKRRTSKRGFLKRYAALKIERDPWVSHYREIAELTHPRRLRLLYSDRNRGQKLSQKIINSTQIRALRILSSGMMSGISSPARPWFRLITPYDELMDSENVRGWLHEVEELMRTVFSRSNIYNALPLCYRDLGAWGTSAICVEEDDLDVIRAYSYPVGSYCVQNSERMTIDTLYHETSMTVGQIAQKFGLDNASQSLKLKWERNEHDTSVPLLHVIEPNETYNASQLGKQGKRWRSVWMELEGGLMDGPPLYEGNGYHEFPCMVPRWDVNGQDAYGESPAMEALGDIKGLQQLEKRKLSALDKATNPPMVGPVTLQQKHRSTLAGDVTFVESDGGSQKFEPAYMVDSRAFLLREEIAEHQKRIMEQFYADLFLMLANSAQAQPITAREVDERHEEKMLQLGPVLERLHDELLHPLIDRVFEIMLRKGLVPPAPPELQGMELRVEFISVLAQAQKLLGTVSLERLVAFVGSNVEVYPEAADKLDMDEVIDDYAGMLGTSPSVVRTGEKLKAIRDQKAKEQQMAAMAAAAGPMKDASSAALNMASADARQPGTIAGLINALQPGIPQ